MTVYFYRFWNSCRILGISIDFVLQEELLLCHSNTKKDMELTSPTKSFFYPNQMSSFFVRWSGAELCFRKDLLMFNKFAISALSLLLWIATITLPSPRLQ
uniref:Uncharacterized protein n=1 Tax=Lepeophtheirus salmonis TaxID=72036 RepID=A0A0K2TA64_LEPSM